MTAANSIEIRDLFDFIPPARRHLLKSTRTTALYRIDHYLGDQSSKDERRICVAERISRTCG